MEMWRITLPTASLWQIISKFRGGALLLVFVDAGPGETLWLTARHG